MTDKQKNVPYRRFKEFENADAWEQRKLGDIVSFFSGLTYTPADVVSKPGTLVLRSSNVKDNTIINADDVYVKSEAVNSANVQNGDVIVVVRNGSRNLIGKHAEVKKEMANTVIGAFMTGVRYDTPNFVNALFDTNQFKIEISKNLGATINQITTGNFKNMLFKFPTDNNEQNKIGEFFSQLDHLITLHQRKYDKLKKLKSAYLTEMFPAEGERKPKRRFSGFTDDWEQRKLSEMAVYQNGRAHEGSQFNYGKFELVNLNSISINGGLKQSGKFVHDTEETLNKNDLVMVLSDVGHGDLLGRVALIPEDNKFVLNQRVALLRPNKTVVPEFLFYFINAHQKYFKSQGAGMSQLNISKTTVENFTNYVPIYEEQFKIGQIMEKLDHLITLHQQQLEKLKNLKQAYLNEMFV
jgi:type I restriction enzyme S subunit